LTSALDESEWSDSTLGRFAPEEIVTGMHWIGAWVGPHSRFGLCEEGKKLDPVGILINRYFYKM
jgi:hypothetical protein